MTTQAYNDFIHFILINNYATSDFLLYLKQQYPDLNVDNMDRMSTVKDKSQNNDSNQYLDFIKQCREKATGFSDEQLSQCQTHHIVPRHHFKSEQLSFDTFEFPENRVKLTFEDHVKAHELRYEVYGELGDKAAFISMRGLTEEGMLLMQQLGGKAANQIFKRESRQMFDPKFQKEMSDRSMARPDAREIRSEGGKKGNRKRHQNVTVRKEDRYLWFFKGTEFLCTFGFDNGGDLCKELFKAKETKLARVSPLIKGQKKSLYGWSCQKID